MPAISSATAVTDNSAPSTDSVPNKKSTNKFEKWLTTENIKKVALIAIAVLSALCFFTLLVKPLIGLVSVISTTYIITYLVDLFKNSTEIVNYFKEVRAISDLPNTPHTEKLVIEKLKPAIRLAPTVIKLVCLTALSLVLPYVAIMFKIHFLVGVIFGLPVIAAGAVFSYKTVFSKADDKLLIDFVNFVLKKANTNNSIADEQGAKKMIEAIHKTFNTTPPAPAQNAQS
jgi:hypothetical protein